MGFLRRLEGFVGVFEGLFGVLVAGLVSFFVVVRGGGAVGVGGEFVKFGGADVRLFGHSVLFLGFFLHYRIISFSRLSHCGHLRRSQADAEEFQRLERKRQDVEEAIPARAVVVHSSRSRIMGSIESARCAGIQVASSPSSNIARTVPAKTSGSRGVA
jgi:hypothetical protein